MKNCVKKKTFSNSYSRGGQFLKIKAFTLIELLAVIIVLAVIAVVAVPIVLDVMDDVKKEADLQTVYGIIDTAELFFAESTLDDTKKNQLTTNKDNPINLYNQIEMSNDIPDNGKLYVNNKGQVALSVVINDRCYKKEYYEQLQVLENSDCNLDYVGGADETAPEQDFIIDTIPNENGWLKEDTKITIDASDNESKVDYIDYCIGFNCTPTGENIVYDSKVEVEVPDSNSTMVCYIVTNKAGISSEKVCTEEIKKDTQAPTVGTIDVVGIPGENGWYTTDIEIKPVEGMDDGSGHFSTVVEPQEIKGDTQGTVVKVTTTDKAGNVSIKEYTVKIDKTKPVVEFNVKDIDGKNGWYVSEVTLEGVVTDTNYSKLRWCEGIDCTPTNETTASNKMVTYKNTKGTQLCIIGIDEAGNESGKICSEVIKVDTVEPEFSGIEDLKVEKDDTIDLLKNVKATDVISDIDGNVIVDSSALDITKTGTYDVKYKVYDKAGNEKEITRKVIVSAGAPTITFTAEAGAINQYGWSNKDFYVTVNVKDNTGHGIKEFKMCTATTDTCDVTNSSTITGKTTESRLIATESNNNRICVQAIDQTNQTSEVVCSDAYKLDKTSPTAGTIKINGTLGENNWYKTDISIGTIDGEDGLSGHLNTTVDTTSIITNTSNKTVTVTTKDKAGNEATRIYTLKLDKTTPSVTIAKTSNSTKLTATVTPSTTESNYTYAWYKNGSVISGATGITYTPTTAGKYTLKVTTGAGISATSNEITIQSYTVTYDLNGGTGNISSQTKVEDISLTLTSTIPTKSGYIFQGWGSSTTDTSVDYASGASYTGNANITLYAIWKAGYKCTTGTLTADSSKGANSGGYICVTSAETSQECTLYSSENNLVTQWDYCVEPEYATNYAQMMDELGWERCSNVSNDCIINSKSADCDECHTPQNSTSTQLLLPGEVWGYYSQPNSSSCTGQGSATTRDYGWTRYFECATYSNVYRCPSGWSTYSGSGSSLKCYSAATLGS